jgi:cell division septation protein DedD
MAILHGMRLGLAVGMMLSLSACQEGGGLLAQKPADETDAAAAGDSALAVVARDVEAPNVYQLKDEGLWDGRPSLGGVWVAHSDVGEPERVIIRNPANGNSVVGALFRREAANPGPSIQVSSDAAEALGMLAGAPATIEVVALKREELPEPAAADPVEFPPAPTEPVIADAADAPSADGASAVAAAAGLPSTGATGADPIAVTAAAAIDEAEGIASAATDAPATDGAPAAAADAGAAVPADGQRPCPFWRKKKCEAERAAAAAAGGAVVADAAATGSAAPADGIADAPIAAAPLGTAQPEVIAATPAAAGTLTRAYVQIGIFSVEANAQRAADQMKAAGMTATVKTDAAQGKTFWRVIVGPAASVAERDALASRVKGIGYPDAYPVSR